MLIVNTEKDGHGIIGGDLGALGRIAVGVLQTVQRGGEAAGAAAATVLVHPAAA